MLPLLRTGAQGVVLIKPQFEAGRENHRAKIGLVQSSRVHMQVLNNILQLFSAQGLTVQLLCPSPIQGGSGNIEYLAVVQKGGEAAYLPEIAAVVQQAFAQAKKEKTNEVVLFHHLQKGNAPEVARKVCLALHRNGMEVWADPRCLGLLGDMSFICYAPFLEAVQDADVAVAIGGDGTILHCARHVVGTKAKSAGHQHRTAGLSGIYGAGSDW